MRPFPTFLLAFAAIQGGCGGGGGPRASAPPTSPLAAADSAAQPTTSAPVAPMSLTHLLTQQNSGYTEEAELVVRDAAAWNRAWRALHGGTPPGAPAPAVDFARDMILLVATGQRGTGGYEVRITDVAPAGGGATVRYTATEPGPECMTTQALTAPVDVVRAPRVGGEVRFERRVVKQPC